MFGCVAYAHVPDCLRQKLDKKASKLRFVGYCTRSKGYRLYDEKTKKLIMSRDVTFNETNFDAVKAEAEQTEVVDIEPRTIEDAFASDHAKEWKATADSEYKSLMKNETWELVEWPQDRGKQLVVNGYSRSSIQAMEKWSDSKADLSPKDTLSSSCRPSMHAGPCLNVGD